MRIRTAFLGLGFALAGTAASAQDLYSYVDAYYIPDTEIEVDAGSLGSGSVSGDGYGIKGAVDLSRGLFLAAEWGHLEYEEANTRSETDAWRAGLGAYMGWGPTNGFYGYGEYIRLESDDSEDEADDGYGAHIGFQTLILPSLGGRIQGGYASIDVGDGDLKGPEYLVSLNLAVTEMISLITEYRYSDFEVESSSGLTADFTLTEWRAGARFSFGH